MIVECSIDKPPQLSDDWHTRWEGPDKGLICAWVSGIQKAQSDPEMAAKAGGGGLPVTPFKGGIKDAIKSKTKIGSLHYIAFWQGLRGESLHIDQDSEPAMTCTRTGVTINYTGDIARLLQAGEEDNEESGK